MRNLVSKMKNPNIKISNTVLEFLVPNKVYIPISEDVTMLLKSKEVYKGTPIYQRNQKIIHSPISGKIIKIIKRKNYLEKDQLFLEIQNNFQENDLYKGSLETTTILVRDIKKLLKENKDITKFNLQNTKSIYLNAIEDEPYNMNNPFLIKYHKDEILLFLDALATVYKIGKVIIYLKENECESIEQLNQVLETYPNIKLEIVPDIYPIGNDFYLKQYLKIPKEITIFHCDEILELYYDIVKMRKKDFYYITLTGDAIKEPHVIKIKKGALLNDILPLIEVEENCDVFVNSLLKKQKSNISNIIITDEIHAIYFMKPNFKKEIPCMHCGKCNIVCPMKCNPYKSVVSNGQFKNKNCIHCGLCSFVCPSYINMEKYLEKGEEEDAL